MLFVSYAPGALAMFDREMRYIAVSRRWLTESGLEGRDLRGLSHYDLYPDIPDRWREIHRRALNGEVLGAEEEPFRRTDGVTQWVRWEMRPWHGADGQVAGVLVVSVDITARKQTEQALKDREEHLRAVFEAAVDAIFAIDEKGLIQSANAAATRLLGYEESELIGQNVSTLMPEPDRSAHNQYLQDYLTTDKAKFSGYGREVEALSKDGTRLTVELSVGEAAQGGRRLFVGVLHDVTERRRAAIRQLELLEQVKQSEAEARKQQALFRSVFESAPEGIVLTDTQHRATMVNPALQRIFGYDADELIGALPSKFYARPEFWKPIDEATSSTGNGNPTRTFQIVRCKRKNGAVFPGATIRVPYRDSRGNLYGYLRIFRDVTPEQKREEERRQAQRLESLGELTGGIAHDFNNLLTVISGNLQLLEMKLGDERLAHYLSEAKHAVHNGLLKLRKPYSHIELGQAIRAALTN
jgi:PAS domain S-box-containing protein